MAGIRLQPEDPDASQARPPASSDLISDDDRSVAADSWSIKSDYGSTLDDEQRHADASEALSVANFRAASDYRLLSYFTRFCFHLYVIRIRCLDQLAGGKLCNAGCLKFLNPLN